MFHLKTVVRKIFINHQQAENEKVSLETATKTHTQPGSL